MSGTESLNSEQAPQDFEFDVEKIKRPDLQSLATDLSNERANLELKLATTKATMEAISKANKLHEITTYEEAIDVLTKIAAYNPEADIYGESVSMVLKSFEQSDEMIASAITKLGFGKTFISPASDAGTLGNWIVKIRSTRQHGVGEFKAQEQK